MNEQPASTTPPAPKPPTPAADSVAQQLGKKPLPALASILIPCCGQLEYTKLCVPSILRHTRKPFELIFLDIGSLDGTNAYLAGLAAGATAPSRISVVRADLDLGIATAVEQAIQLARGDFLVLLNNDTVVTDAWLNQLTGLATSAPAPGLNIGLVGPMSNYAAPPQLVEHVHYRIGPKKNASAGAAEWLVDTAAIDAFAHEWRSEHRGHWQDAERLGGFCLLIKREVLKRIGHLREAGDLALFDTDLLSAKARQVGYTLGLCRDLFIHHFGTRTFAHGAPQADKVTR
jgi:O-antigen biosynthesis protein